MHYQDVQIGQQVVRSKGDYVVGRIGEVVNKDEAKNRAQISWSGNTKTWVSVNAIEPTFIPYEIIKIDGKNPQYRRK